LARPELAVRRVRGSAELEAALALRTAVFCDEQGVPVPEELDGRDREALHVVALRGDAVVGTCRVLVEGGVARLGRMAVERSARRSGVGARLLATAEAAAREEGAWRVVLAAQRHAEPFYARHGYRAGGQPFDEAGIEHVRMEKALP
jgi:predicted GNAT family N-acyltransferase